MSLQAVAFALDFPPDDPLAKLVLIGLAEYADPSGVADIDEAYLRAFSGLDATGLDRAFAHLRQCGVVRGGASTVTIVGVIDETPVGAAA
jgi:hypothetical protein